MRSYGQYCGLARSLEVVGDRWNLLADRLRDLEASGVIERRRVRRPDRLRRLTGPVLAPIGGALAPGRCGN